MSSKRDGTGYFNRGARRGGGDRAVSIPAAGTAVLGPVLGPMCVIGRHDGCAGNCACACHTYEPPRVELAGNLHDVLAYVCAGGDCDLED